MDDLQIRSSKPPTWGSRSNPEAPASRTKTDQTDSTANTKLSFRVVEPAAIFVKDLTVHFDPTPSLFRATGALSRKCKDADIQQGLLRKTILNRITAWMPIGSLIATIGASGSGKTFLSHACMFGFHLLIGS